MYKILLVEDDRIIRENVVDYFNNQNEVLCQIDTAYDGEEGLAKIYENTYDLVLLDIMLPGIDGFEICKNIRKDNDIPVIFLTAMAREEDILRGYDYGCDDYVIKPFSLATLKAKVNALLNRAKGTVISNSIVVGNINLNPRTMVCTVSGNEIDLAPKQYLILKLLMENKGAVISRDSIVSRVWGYEYEGEERNLDNHMKKLRKVLGNSAKQIKTVIGKGYKIID